VENSRRSWGSPLFAEKICFGCSEDTSTRLPWSGKGEVEWIVCDLTNQEFKTVLVPAEAPLFFQQERSEENLDGLGSLVIVNLIMEHRELPFRLESDATAAIFDSRQEQG
jgi:hypothetical protein